MGLFGHYYALFVRYEGRCIIIPGWIWPRPKLTRSLNLFTRRSKPDGLQPRPENLSPPPPSEDLLQVPSPPSATRRQDSPKSADGALEARTGHIQTAARDSEDWERGQERRRARKRAKISPSWKGRRGEERQFKIDKGARSESKGKLKDGENDRAQVRAPSHRSKEKTNGQKYPAEPWDETTHETGSFLKQNKTALTLDNFKLVEHRLS